MGDLKAGINAMRSDADKWDKASARLEAPRRTAASLSLSALDVSMFGEQAGLDKTYAEAQQLIETTLLRASEVFHGIGTALLQSAAAYEQAEADNVHGLRKAGEGN